LARDLHDAVTQTLFSASLIAEALPHIWENNPKEGRKLLGELRQLNKGALADMRSLLMELRPATLVEANLSDLIRQLIESLSGRTSANIKITRLDKGDLPEEIHLGFYRIAQEALTNVIKHARAKNVQVALSIEPVDSDLCGINDRVSANLEIEDDGCGFEIEKVPSDHFGLKNIRDRAKSITAKITITSQPAKGTRIQLSWEGEVRSNE
jgi:signal transduction histidine kinase